MIFIYQIVSSSLQIDISHNNKHPEPRDSDIITNKMINN
jgi:hypothetical protein